MSHRLRTSLSTVAAVVVIVSLSAVPAVAQSDAPQTAWGQPDLQGVWDFRSITPLQRPERLENQEFLTEEEAAELEQAAVARDAAAWDREARRTEAGGNVGAYNNFWMDRGQKAVGTRRTSLIVDPPYGRMPEQTTAARERAGVRRDYRREHPADGPEDFSNGVRCILGFNAGPPFTPSAYNNNMQLFQTPDHVVVVTEMVHTARIIPLDGSPHLPSNVQQWSGDSRGHWEGETLVVETTNHTDKTRWRGSTPDMRLVERFTRVDAETLLYEFTVTDPTTLTAPWTAAVPLLLNPEPMFEYACHEGNYSMGVMLAGTREEEKAAAEQP